MISIGFIVIKKMLMSDDFVDEVIQLLIAVFIILIAWWTTNITEQPYYRTVFLFERRLRRRTTRARLTTHIESASIGGTQTEETSTPAVGESTPTETPPNSEENKPPIASGSNDTVIDNTNFNNNESREQRERPRNIEEEELETIVQIMDTDANVVRLKRLAYYKNQQKRSTNGESDENQATTSNEQSTEVLPEDSLESTQEPIMEHNYAERNEEMQTNDTNNIRIKLKYLNDELKLVDGRLEEQLGDFKRRHFQLEFSSNKLVRLIFNGQVLQPDTETLQNCGLFDNCVVHCLVHQQRNVFNEPRDGSSYNSDPNRRSMNSGLSQGNNSRGREWDLGNLLFVFVGMILGSAWYFRYEYAHLYTVTATVALVAVTVIFTIFLIGVYFPDPQPPQPPAEHLTVPT